MITSMTFWSAPLRIAPILFAGFLSGCHPGETVSAQYGPFSGNSTIIVSSATLEIKTLWTVDKWTDVTGNHTEFSAPLPARGRMVVMDKSGAGATIPAANWGNWSITIGSHQVTIFLNAQDKSVHARTTAGTWVLSGKTLTHSLHQPPSNVTVHTQLGATPVCAAASNCPSGTRVVCIGSDCP